MATFPNVSEQLIRTCKISDAGITDADLGKAVVIDATASDTVKLAADGDNPYGFINSIEVGTEGGKVVVGVVIGGRVRVTCDGAITIGAKIEVGAMVAAGTALAAGVWQDVSAHATPVAGEKHWVFVSGSGTDNTHGVIELQ